MGGGAEVPQLWQGADPLPHLIYANVTVTPGTFTESTALRLPVEISLEPDPW